MTSSDARRNFLLDLLANQQERTQQHNSSAQEVHEVPDTHIEAIVARAPLPPGTPHTGQNPTRLASAALCNVLLQV